ncbi:MAG: hypothetical protein ED859_08225 [Desulfuromonadales bacterium]|nr:MAG: hypothetical protein ED859_08225 [Desulfuromonadales bacterium]
MRIDQAALLCLALLFLAGCRNPYIMEQRFEESFREHNRMLRWQELEQSCMTFAAVEVKDACLERAKAAKGVSVADFRVMETELDSKKGTARVRLEIDYFILPAPRLKTIQDVQKWRHVPDEGLGRWYLETPPPEFR